MYELITNENEKKAAVILKGELTVQNILEIKNTIGGAFQNYESIVVNQKEAAQYDLSYIQLLIALQKSAAAQGKKFQLVNNDKPEFRNSVLDSGYDYESRFSKIVIIENTSGEENE